MKIYPKICSYLLKLDGAVLVNDSLVVKLLKRKILKPIGYFFRKQNFNIKYK